jgi:acyl-CoA:acyl-CoA alkyltransferase
MQVADAMIRTGQYRRVLIASGEKTSVSVRWNLRSNADFISSFPGYTMGDGGAALVLEADESDDSDSERRGIIDSRFVAASKHWSIGTLPGGGTARTHDPDAAYFDMDGRGLQKAFLELGPDPVLALLAAHGWTWEDFDLVAIHQVALPYLPPIFERLGVPDDRTVITVVDYGNIASVVLPLQLHLARERGMVGPGSLVLLIGLAGGISLGLVAVRL